MSRDVEYLNCPNPQHKRQLLMSVCIDSNCINRQLVCYLCEKDKHLGHHTLTLDEFLDEIDTKGEREADSGILELSKQSIEKVSIQKSQCMVAIGELRKQINMQIGGLERQTEIFFNSMEHGIEYEIDVYMASMGKGFVYSHKKRVEKVLDEFRKCLRFYHQGDKSKDNVTKEIYQKVDKCLNLSKQIETTLDIATASSLDSLKKMESRLMENCFTLAYESTMVSQSSIKANKSKGLISLQQIPGGLSKWSHTLKHPDISLFGCVAKRQTESVKCKHVCVAMDTPFDDSQPTQFNYRISINEKVCGIIIGMCLQSKIKEAAFIRDDWARNRGHGHYLIGDDGMTWSQSDASVNYKMKSFKFLTGDIVGMQYELNKVVFTKNETERWEMEVVSAPKGDCYRLCAYLFMKGDSVSLLQCK